MRKKLFTVLMIMSMLLMLSPVGVIHVNAATNLAKEQISFKKATMKKGSTLQLCVYNGFIKSCKSSNKKVATVSKIGTLKAKKNGKAKITVTVSNGTTYTCNVKVQNHKHRYKNAGISVIAEQVKVKDAWDETVTKKVKVKDAWDEEVVDCYRAIQNDTGEDVTDVANPAEWCESHHCDIHFFGGGPCVSNCTIKPFFKTVHHDAEYKTVTETIHHDAEYVTVTTPVKANTVKGNSKYKLVKKCKCGAQQ